MHPKALDLANRLYQEGDLQSLLVTGLGLQAQGAHDQSEQLLLCALAANPSDEQA